MKFLEKVPKDAIIGMEATNQYHKTLEWFLKKNGYSVYVMRTNACIGTKKKAHLSGLGIDMQSGFG